MRFSRLMVRIRRAWRHGKTLARDTKGATAVMFTFMTVVVFGSATFGIDTATWHQTGRKLQTGADMAVMATAADLALQTAIGYDGDSPEDIATDLLERAGIDLSTITLMTVNSPPSSGAYAGNSNAIEITVSQNVPIFFAGLFIEGNPQATARAVALAGQDSDLCVLALHPTVSGGIYFSGNSDVVVDCGIGTNSSAADAVIQQGSSNVTATTIRTVGGIDDSGGITGGQSPYSNPASDPFADLGVPFFSGCDSNGVNANGHATNTLSPGVYCGDVRLGAQSDTTFSPGEYIFDNADLIITAQADVYGEDVSFFFTNSSDVNSPGRLQMNGGSTVEMYAPTFGTYKDILFMRDPDASDVTTDNSERWVINGSADPFFDGAIYVPNAEVEFLGNSDPTGGCFVIVAGAVTFTGNVDMAMNCIGTDTIMAGAITTLLVE